MSWRSWCATLVVLFALFAPLASAQDGAGRERAMLVDRLTLNSATTMRAFQARAAEDQRQLYAQLSARDAQIAATLSDIRLERGERRRLEAELSGVTTERLQLSERLAHQDMEFSAERAALIEQFTGIVATASPEKAAALRRFADGDRVGAFEVIADITYAENRARERAAIAASVQNINGLLDLAWQMVMHGEKSYEDVQAIQIQRLQLDPNTIEHHLSVINSYSSMLNSDEAIAAAAAALPYARDRWDVAAIETEVFDARALRLPYVEGQRPWLAAIQALEEGRPPVSQWSAEDQLHYCAALSPIIENATQLRLTPAQNSNAQICTDIYARANKFSGLLTVLEALARSEIDRRRYDVARRVTDLYQGNLAALDSAMGNRFPVFSALLRFKVSRLEASIAYGEGRLDESNAHFRRLVEAGARARPLTTDQRLQDDITSVLEFVSSEMAAVDGDFEQARRNLAVAMDPPLEFSVAALEHDPQLWNSRFGMLAASVRYSVALGDIEGAAAAVDQARPIVAAVIGQLPPPPAEIRFDTEQRICTFLELALAMTRMREAQGDLDAAERLATLPGFETGLERMPLVDSCYPEFRVRAFVELGAMAAQRGNLELARQHFDTARRFAGSQATEEPTAFIWRELDTQARFRLAQIDDDPAALVAVRQDAAALQTEARRFHPEPWLADLAAWSPGQPVTWFVAPRAVAAR